MSNLVKIVNRKLVEKSTLTAKLVKKNNFRICTTVYDWWSS